MAAAENQQVYILLPSGQLAKVVQVSSDTDVQKTIQSPTAVKPETSPRVSVSAEGSGSAQVPQITEEEETQEATQVIYQYYTG